MLVHQRRSWHALQQGCAARCCSPAFSGCTPACCSPWQLQRGAAHPGGRQPHRPPLVRAGAGGACFLGQHGGPTAPLMTPKGSVEDRLHHFQPASTGSSSICCCLLWPLLPISGGPAARLVRDPRPLLRPPRERVCEARQVGAAYLGRLPGHRLLLRPLWIPARCTRARCPHADVMLSTAPTHPTPATCRRPTY